MPKLLSRSKHEEFESNSSLPRRKEEQKVKKREHYRNAFPASTVHPASTMHPTACSPAFHAIGFLLQFLFLPILTLVIALVSVFFL